MTADVELLPCPCGAPAKIYPTGTEIGPREKLVASCDDPECQWSMIGFGPEQVTERWNRRANTEALRERVSRLDEVNLELGRQLVEHEDRAERLAEALRFARTRFAPYMDDTDRAAFDAALHPTAAQEDGRE